MSSCLTLSRPSCGSFKHNCNWGISLATQYFKCSFLHWRLLFKPVLAQVHAEMPGTAPCSLVLFLPDAQTEEDASFRIGILAGSAPGYILKCSQILKRERVLRLFYCPKLCGSSCVDFWTAGARNTPAVCTGLGDDPSTTVGLLPALPLTTAASCLSLGLLNSVSSLARSLW